MIYIGLVQPNYQVGPTELNAYYLPYSVGVLWAYAKNTISVKCEVTDWLFRRDPLQETAEKLSKNHIVAMSCYIWNRRYNYKLAKLIKQINPNVLIIMGGPEPPITNKKLFSDIVPHVDIMVKQEGEKAFALILENFNTPENFKNIPGLLLNVDGVAVDTGPSSRLTEHDMIYSPYLSGVYEKLMADNPDIEWNTTLETNRGCPYQCTFCDWGGLTYSKVKKINLQRVLDEIEWMGKNKIGATHIADANFGMFVDRDNMIVDKLLEVQAKYGHPYRTSTSWAKNQKSEVLAIAKKLMHSAFNDGLTISVQSLDDHTLKTIKRSNLEMNKISEICDEANAIGLPMSTEIILPLPGETLDTWKNGIIKLLDLGQHNGVQVYQTQVLENTELNLVQRKENKIEIMEAYGYMPNSTADNEECPESVSIVTETDSMPKNDVIKSYMFFWFINTFHVAGYAQLYARFLKKNQNLSYKTFYENLEKYIDGNSWYIKSKKIVESTYANWLEDGKPVTLKTGEVDTNHILMPFHSVMNIHVEENYDEVHQLVYSYVKNTYNIEKTIIEDLYTLSKNYVVNYGKIHSYPNYFKLRSNLIEYIFNHTVTELIEGTFTGTASYNENKSLPKISFLQNLYYSRRRAFGKTVLKQNTTEYLPNIIDNRQLELYNSV